MVQYFGPRKLLKVTCSLLLRKVGRLCCRLSTLTSEVVFSMKFYLVSSKVSCHALEPEDTLDQIKQKVSQIKNLTAV